MADAITQVADMVVPEVMEYYTSYEWFKSLSVVDGMLGLDSEGQDIMASASGAQQLGVDRGYPFRATNFGSLAGGMLSDGGQFVQRPKFKPFTNPVTKRDVTSVAALDSLKVTSRNDAGVLCNMKCGAYAITPDAENLSKARSGELQQFITSNAVMEARFFIQTYLIAAAVGAIGAMTAAAHTVAAYGAAVKTNMSPNLLNQAVFKMADMPHRIGWFVFRSGPMQDLITDNIGRSYAGVGDVVLSGGLPKTLGRNFAMVDDASLFVAGGGVAGFDEFLTLGLGPDFMDVSFVRPITWYTPYQPLDKEQVIIKLRADLDIALAINGFKWNQALANPAASDLATTGNWTPQYTDAKEVHAVMIQSNSSIS